MAIPQTLARLENASRELRQRAFRGAVRTAQADEVAGTTPGEWSAMLTVTVISGRWTAHGSGLFRKNPSIGDERFQLSFMAFDLDSGEEVTLESDSFPIAMWVMPHTPGELSIPMSIFGDFVSESNSAINLSLVARDVSTDATNFTFDEPRLMLMPW